MLTPYIVADSLPIKYGKYYLDHLEYVKKFIFIEDLK